jgi:hypothetical protein
MTTPTGDTPDITERLDRLIGHSGTLTIFDMLIAEHIAHCDRGAECQTPPVVNEAKATIREAAQTIKDLRAERDELRELLVMDEETFITVKDLRSRLQEAEKALRTILPFAEDSGWGVLVDGKWSTESEWKAALSAARLALCPHPEVHSPDNSPCQWCGE